MTPKYLLKFVSQKCHAEALLNGSLFTRPAEYYIELEKKKKGQGDEKEATITPDSLLYKNYNMPIFCMLLVCEEDLNDGMFMVDERIVEDFSATHIAVIPFESFHSAIGKDVEGYSYITGLVEYRKIREEEFTYFLLDSSGRNLFVKDPSLYYQKEFRIVIQTRLYQKPNPMVESHTYMMNGKINDGTIAAIDELLYSDHKYSLRLG